METKTRVQTHYFRPIMPQVLAQLLASLRNPKLAKKNQIGPGVRSYKSTGRNYHRMAPTPENTASIWTRQRARYAARHGG